MYGKINKIKVINRMSKNQIQIALAVSGGADSIFLLYKYLENLELLSKTVVLHINHQTRQECTEESAFVKMHCDLLGVLFVELKAKSLALDTANFEEKARNERYRLLSEYAEQYHITKILTAHHQDDLIETIFLKILRGSLNLFIPYQRYIDKEKKILVERPLLKVSKDTILNYLQEKKISYINDSSNLNNKYLRNYLRLDILPLLKRKVSFLTQKLIMISEQRVKEEAFFEKYTQEAIKRIFNNNQGKVSEFLKEDVIIQERMLQALAIKYFRESLSYKKLQEMIRIITTNQTSSLIVYTSVWGEIIKEQEKIVIICENHRKNLEKNRFIIHNRKIYKNLAYLDISIKIGEGLKYTLDDEILLRDFQEGEKIIWNKGSKKIASILKDKKIPYSERSLCDVIQKNEILVGIISQNYSYIIPKERSEKNENGIYIKKHDNKYKI